MRLAIDITQSDVKVLAGWPNEAFEETRIAAIGHARKLREGLDKDSIMYDVLTNFILNQEKIGPVMDRLHATVLQALRSM